MCRERVFEMTWVFGGCRERDFDVTLVFGCV